MTGAESAGDDRGDSVSRRAWQPLVRRVRSTAVPTSANREVDEENGAAEAAFRFRCRRRDRSSRAGRRGVLDEISAGHDDEEESRRGRPRPAQPRRPVLFPARKIQPPSRYARRRGKFLLLGCFAGERPRPPPGRRNAGPRTRSLVSEVMLQQTQVRASPFRAISSGCSAGPTVEAAWGGGIAGRRLIPRMGKGFGYNRRGTETCHFAPARQIRRPERAGPA